MSYVTLIGYYVLGVPAVFLLTYKLNGFGADLGINGIWLGFGIANIFCFIAFGFGLLRIDLSK